MEYAIWGVHPGELDEAILYTKATTAEQAKQVVTILARKGCTELRIQTLDLGCDDLAQSFRKCITK